MTSSYTILLLFQVHIHSTIIFISQDLVYFNHMPPIIRLGLYLRVGKFNLLSLSEVLNTNNQFSCTHLNFFEIFD